MGELGELGEVRAVDFPLRFSLLAASMHPLPIPAPPPLGSPGSSAENTENGVKVAIKKISNVFGKEADVVDAKRILREIRLMRHFHHENVRQVVA